MTASRSSAPIPIVLSALLAIAILYFVSYLVLVDPRGVRDRSWSDHWANPWADRSMADLSSQNYIAQDFILQHYRCGGTWSERIFWPLEQLDRRIRPNAWVDQGFFGTRVWPRLKKRY